MIVNTTRNMDALAGRDERRASGGIRKRQRDEADAAIDG